MNIKNKSTLIKSFFLAPFLRYHYLQMPFGGYLRTVSYLLPLPVWLDIILPHHKLLYFSQSIPFLFTPRHLYVHFQQTLHQHYHFNPFPLQTWQIIPYLLTWEVLRTLKAAFHIHKRFYHFFGWLLCRRYPPYLP